MKRSIEYSHKKVVYAVHGSGPVVVLVHGFGEAGFVWDSILPLLPAYRLIIPDLPGSGDSLIGEDSSMEGLAEVLHAILQEEQVEKCVMVGHSMGGYITLAFVQKYPSLLLGFGLFHSSAFGDTDEKIGIRKKGIQFLRENGAGTFLKTSIPNLYAPATKEENKALLEAHLDKVQNQSTDALIHYYTAMINRKNRTDVLRETLLPVLFIFGKWDTAVPLEDGLKQSHLPQLSYIHILDQSGHMGMNEEVENSGLILNQYLSATFTLPRNE